MSNYGTKDDLKDETGIGISNLGATSVLAGSKAEVVKIDIDELKIVPVDLSKLSNIADNNIF